MSLTEGLAQWLENRNLLNFDPAGMEGDTFIEIMPPQTPNMAVSLTIAGGVESDSKLPYDEPLVQIRVRGDATGDPRGSRDRAAAIWGELHGLSDLMLPDGTYLVLAVAVQSAPQSIGQDALNRYEYVFDVRCEVRSVTVNRP